MKYEVLQDNGFPAANEWRVEAIDRESGDCFVTIFSGPDSEERAKEYAAWKESGHA